MSRTVFYVRSAVADGTIVRVATTAWFVATGIAIGLFAVRPRLITLAAAAGLIALAGSVLIIAKPRPTVLGYAWALYLLGGITSARVRDHGFGQLFAFVPPQAGYAADVILLGLLATLLLRALFDRIAARPGLVDVLSAALLITAAFSLFVNSPVPSGNALGAGRLLIAMLSGYFVLRYLPIRGEGLERLWRVLYVVSIIQLPLILVQVAGSLWLGWADDLINGSFSRYPKLMAYQLVFFAIGVAAYANDVAGSWRPRLVRAAVLAAVGLALTSARIVFALIPLIGLIVLLPQIRVRPVRAIRASVLSVGLFAVTLGAFVFIQGGLESSGAAELLNYMRDPAGVYQYFFGRPDDWAGYEGRLSRGGALVYLYEHLPEYPGGRWLGVGPGMMTAFDFGDSSPIPVLFVLQANITQAGVFLGEFGLIGLALSLLLVVAGVPLVLRPILPHRSLALTIQKAYPAIVVTFLLLQIYSRVWFEVESAFIFWAATVYLMSATEEADAARRAAWA